jgi:poly-gamma-glutamate capsule biosynthesis protein CapA/YwtB (metallophosphatase superfamily)
MKNITFILAQVFLASALPTYAQDKLKLLFVGDIMGHGPQIESAMIEKDKVYDYSPCFEYLAPFIKQADLAIGNLELTLPGKPPYTGYPTFKSPNEVALALRSAGFDLLVTANNHSNDGGLLGLQNTIKVVQDLGFYQTGTFIDSTYRAALYPLIVYKGPFKLAVLNYTYGTNGIPNPKPGVTNVIDEKVIEKDLAQARAHQPDAIIVVTHWGAEYQLNESESQRQLAQKILDWGATFVIGAHPHVVQPIKSHSTKNAEGGARQGLVVYSLGNFISGQTKLYTDIGLMVEIDLEKNQATGKTAVSRCEYLPVYRHIQTLSSGKKVFRSIPVSAFEDGEMQGAFPIAAPTLAAMKNSANVIRANLNKYGAVERKVKAKDLLTPAPAGNR